LNGDVDRTLARHKAWRPHEVSKADMISIRRQTAGVLSAAILSALLFRYWLIMPVLQYLNENQWRVVGLGVVAIAGGIWAFFQWNILLLLVGAVIGVLTGGTWAELQFSHGSWGAAFESNFDALSGDMLLYVLVMTLSGCGARFVKGDRVASLKNE
jgi:uncharacterized membrane protein